MKRREFLIRSACTAGAAWLHSAAFAQRARALTLKPLPRKFSASDTITIGKTGIQTSRLAMGTGTVGSGHHSHQTALGVQGLSRSSLERLRPRPAIFRFGGQLRQPSPRRRGPQARASATKSPSSPRLGRAMPPPLAPISTASAANSAPITSTSV